VRRPAALLVLALLAACRTEAPPALPDAGPPPPGAFTPADVAAAETLDARLARLSLLAAEMETAVAFARGDALRARAARLAPLLEAAAAGADRALDGIRDPRDRDLAVPLVAAARRWPALLSGAVAERLSSASLPPGPALRAVSATDEEVARHLDAYRRSRSTWLLTGPAEGEGVLLFLEARRALEAAEARLGEALPGPGARGRGQVDPERARGEAAAAVGRAREAAGRVEPWRREAARSFVDAQERAIELLTGLAAAPPDPRERASRALGYQAAKVEALEAAAEWSRLTAAR
jgi:hypothetical protein